MKSRIARRIMGATALSLCAGALLAPAAQAGWIAVPTQCHRVFDFNPRTGSLAVYWVCR